MPARSPAPLLARLDALPRFWAYRDLLDQVFEGDEDRLVVAWCDGSLPPAVRDQALETMGLPRLTALLLRYSVRLQLESRKDQP